MYKALNELLAKLHVPKILAGCVCVCVCEGERLQAKLHVHTLIIIAGCVYVCVSREEGRIQ